MGKAFAVRVLLLAATVTAAAAGDGCSALPSARPGRFLLHIVGRPSAFIPATMYRVEVESDLEFRAVEVRVEGDVDGGGWLQAMGGGGLTFSERCLNTLVAESPRPLRTASFLWTAPRSGCSTLRAFIKVDYGWVYQNSTICALVEKKQDEKPAECCACDHAKYSLTFSGLWSPETHPKDFPKSRWLTHFSDVIGATHGPDYVMWAPGRPATYGLKQLAEYGIVREMETELRNSSSKLRSIVKAAGLWHPNLNGNTSAVLRVDPKRHLISLATMFGPSPDWFVGVSGLNLCRPDCSWVESIDLDLYPYDAGTDSGISYMSVKTPSGPGERVRKITTSEPEDERAPFWRGDGGKMAPLGRLHLNRAALFPRPCASLLDPVDVHDNTEDSPRKECLVGDWGDWSDCSAECGAGLRARQRHYIDAELAARVGCDRQLVSREMCIVRPCPDEEEEEEVEALTEVGDCEVTAWGDWTDCSVSCGVGFIMRSRRFMNDTPATHKRCRHVTVQEKDKCMLPVCALPIAPAEARCRAGEWSEWSPCSTSCGSGVRSRTRASPAGSGAACRSLSLLETRNCALAPCAPLPPGTCDLPVEAGPCRGGFDRWAFDKGVCKPFLYGGCRGNANNFHSESECLVACCTEDKTPVQVEVKKSVDCVVSRWSQWSSCTPCPIGIRMKNRTILVQPKNGGKPCPITQKAIKCTVIPELCDAS